MWTVTFSPQKEQVGTLLFLFDDGQGDVWSFSVSIDLGQVKDLSGYATKITSLKAAHDAEKAKVPEYQAAIDALAAALNGGN